MKVIGDICYPNGSYNDSRTGEERTRWLKCGVLLQKEEGEYRVKLEAMPVKMDEPWFSVFTKRKPEIQAEATANEHEQRSTDDFPF